MADPWVRMMRTTRGNEQGAALVIVLLFMVIALILITSVLAVTGNEIRIAGLHRDSVRALELAHAGLQEAVVRIQKGVNFSAGQGTAECDEGFTPSVPLAPGEELRVGRCELSAGVGSLVFEVQADATVGPPNATVGRAVRRLSLIVKTVSLDIPPNIVLSKNVTKGGSADIEGGDVYSETYVEYQKPPDDPAQRTFAGWYVREQKPPTNPTCYTRPCTVDSKWYPGHRRMVKMDADGDLATDPIPADILANTTQNFPTCSTTDPATLLPPGAIRAEDPDQDASTDTTAERELYGFDVDLDNNGNGSPTEGLQNASIDSRKCGLPYRYIQETMLDKDGNLLLDKDKNPIVRWFKTIILEQWFETYYKEATDAGGITNLVPRDGGACTKPAVCLRQAPTKEPDFANNPEFAAIPPYPTQGYIDSQIANANHTRTGGGVITGGSKDDDGQAFDFGCPPADAPPPHTPQPPGCPPGGTTRIIALIGPEDYTINSNINGNGVIVVTGNLTISGTFVFYGSIFVTGKVTIGSGNVTITGGLIAKQTTIMTGNITVIPGQNVGTAAVSNQPQVIVITMWER